MRILFEEWLPDQEDYLNPCDIAENVWPTARGFGPALEFSPYALNQLTVSANSTYGTRGSSGENVILIGSTSQIFEVTESYTSDITSTTGLNSGQVWDFTTFNENILAVRPADAPIAVPLTTIPLADFATVTGSPPDGATCIGYVRDFVVLGATVESGTTYQTRVRWSAFNNFHSWGSDASTQADFQDLRSNFGEIHRIVPGSVGHIFQEDAITRMTYVGPPTIFRFDVLSNAVGTPSGKSVAWTDQWCFFYSKSGFKKLNLGTGEIINIGARKVDEWFYKRQKIYFGSSEPRAAIDVRRKLVFWAFQDFFHTATAPGNDNDHNTVLVYNYELDRWSFMLQDIETLGPGELNDELNDGRDNSCVVVQNTGSMTRDIGFFDGFDSGVDGAVGDNTLEARISTGNFGEDSTLQYIDGVRPLVEGTAPTPTVQVNYRTNLITATPADGNTGEVAINSIGRCDMRVNARYLKFVVQDAGDFDRIWGVEYDPKPSGGR